MDVLPPNPVRWLLLSPPSVSGLHDKNRQRERHGTTQRRTSLIFFVSQCLRVHKSPANDRVKVDDFAFARISSGVPPPETALTYASAI